MYASVSSRSVQRLSTAVETHIAQLLREHEPRLPPAGLYQRVLDKVEAPLIAMALNACGGNKTVAARVLDIDRRTLYRLVARLKADDAPSA